MPVAEEPRERTAGRSVEGCPETGQLLRQHLTVPFAEPETGIQKGRVFPVQPVNKGGHQIELGGLKPRGLEPLSRQQHREGKPADFLSLPGAKQAETSCRNLTGGKIEPGEDGGLRPEGNQLQRGLVQVPLPVLPQDHEGQQAPDPGGIIPGRGGQYPRRRGGEGKEPFPLRKIGQKRKGRQIAHALKAQPGNLHAADGENPGHQAAER